MRRRADLVVSVLTVVTLIYGLGTIGCASVGTGDPVIVRAQDVEVNSTSFCETFLAWHDAHSKEESVQLYKVAEALRTNRTAALATLHAAITAYKDAKTDVNSQKLTEAIRVITRFIEDVKLLWTQKPVSMRIDGSAFFEGAYLALREFPLGRVR